MARMEVDLYAWADRGQRLPDTALRHGYRAMLWKEGDLDFAIVSDMEIAEFENFHAIGARAEKE